MRHRVKAALGGADARAPGARTCLRGHVKTYDARKGEWVCRMCLEILKRKYLAQRRARRLRARRARITARVRPPLAERLWAAGHFEGEGTLSLLSGGRKNVSLPRITLTSTDRAVTDFFHATWPGRVTRSTPKSKNGLAREAFRWTLEHKEAIEGFVLDIRPLLKRRCVRAKADLMIEDIRDRAQLRQTPQDHQRKLERMARMRALNRRGIVPGSGSLTANPR